MRLVLAIMGILLLSKGIMLIGVIILLCALL